MLVCQVIVVPVLVVLLAVISVITGTGLVVVVVGVTAPCEVVEVDVDGVDLAVLEDVFLVEVELLELLEPVLVVDVVVGLVGAGDEAALTV
jgi:hypothetical protein